MIGSALTLIYRELQQLDANLIARGMDGSYHMASSNNATWHNPQGRVGGMPPVENNWVNTHDVAFAVPNFDDFEIPPEFFTMLPDLEPISANVGAGFDVDLDKPWC